MNPGNPLEVLNRSASIPAEEAEWTRRDQRLRFMAGEFRLFTFRFPSVISTQHFSALPEDSLTPPPPFSSTGVEAAVIPAHPIANALPAFDSGPGYIRYSPNQYTRYYVKIEGAFEQYLQKFAAKPRHNLTRSIRKFAESSGGSIDFREYAAPEEMPEFRHLARAISEKTYQEKLFQGGFPAADSFLDEMIALAEQDAIRGYVLFHKQLPAAYAMCFAKGDFLVYESIGYDPQHRQASPGTVLLYLILERLFSEGRFKALDFGEGAAEYKRFFSNASAECAEIYYFRPTIRNRAAVRAHQLTARASRAAVGLLASLRLKQAAKKFFRSARK